MTPYARIMPVHVRRHDRREGYASSLEALLREASSRSGYPKRDVVVTLQADFTDEPDDIATLVKRVEGGADIVTGRVRVVGAGTPRVVRWSRAAWQGLLRRTGRGRVDGDLLSGFRAYRVIAIQKAIREAGDGPVLTTQGWAANAELLGRVAPHSRRTEAVDIELKWGRRQRASRFRPLEASRDLLRLLTAAPPAPVPASGPAEAASDAGLVAEGPRRKRKRSGRRGGRGNARGPAPGSA